jgi:very-short-patch-repair endonuclease
MVADALTILNVEYEPQHRIGRFTVDFFVPALSLAIEVQGDYWHANPKLYDDASLNKTQLRGRKRDERKRAYFASHPEYRYIELWESDIRANPVDCVTSIL